MPSSTDTVSPSMLEVDLAPDRRARPTVLIGTPRDGRWRTRWRSARSGRGRRCWRRASPGRGRGAARGRRSRGLVARRASDLLLAHGADPARHALPARLVAEERGDAAQQVDQVDRVVEHQHHAGAERRARRARAPSNVSGMSRSSGPTKPPAAPPSSTACRRATARATPPASVEQLAQRGAELDLVHAGPGDRARHAEQLAAGRPFGAERGERRPTAEHDRQHVDERLDVVDERRLAEQPDLDRERRLVARLAADTPRSS